MEHLPRRAGQEKSVFPEIPYLCQNKYDEGPFLDYPQRSGLPDLKIEWTLRLNPSLSHAKEQFLAAVPRAELEPFLQNWLFFGLLNEVLGDLYRHEDFITTLSDGGTEKTVVTTVDLLSRLEEWEAKITRDKHSLMAVYEHIAKCLHLAHACLQIQYPDFDNDLKVHLASVAEILGYAASKACDVTWSDDPRRSLIPIDWGDITSEDFRKFVLLERSNCCPSQMQMLMQHFGSLQALSFVASCFHEDNIQWDHASCDGRICRAGDLAASGQITRHVSDSCGCKFLSVDEDLLADCLNKGCLPLLRIKEGTNLDKMSIEVVASTDSTPYVALSHVWADGLGNPSATSLPRCQLSRLKDLIDNLDSAALDLPEDAPEMLLWCDTLCCPVVSREAHNMALRQMYRTYDQATVVLVLDRSLISHRVGGMHVDEACLRIAASRWMTRLWTLQEGALSASKHKLWFQFTKTALSTQTLYIHLYKVMKTDIRRRGVLESVMGRFHTFMTLFRDQGSENQGAQMKDIMDGLLYRSVTVPSDEPLIIATLLALDLSPILASDPEQRMNVLWRIIGTSPSGIDKHIIFHMGPKLLERGLRWAPQTLLFVDSRFAIPEPGGHENRGFLATNRNAMGLVVELAGFRISIAKPAKGLPAHLAGFDSTPRNHDDRHRLFLKDFQGRWYILSHRLCTSDRVFESEEIYAIISELSDPWILYCGSSSPVPDNTKGYHGLLVEEAKAHQSQSNQFTCVEIKSQVHFCRLPADTDEVCQAAYCLAQDLASSTAARRLEDVLGTGTTDLDDPVYKQAFQDFILEFKRLSRSDFALKALAASGNSADEPGFSRIEDYMMRMYRGLYMQIEEYAPGNRKWCVD